MFASSAIKPTINPKPLKQRMLGICQFSVTCASSVLGMRLCIVQVRFATIQNSLTSAFSCLAAKLDFSMIGLRIQLVSNLLIHLCTNAVTNGSALTERINGAHGFNQEVARDNWTFEAKRKVVLSLFFPCAVYGPESVPANHKLDVLGLMSAGPATSPLTYSARGCQNNSLLTLAGLPVVGTELPSLHPSFSVVPVWARLLHSTHELWHAGGAVWCYKCGAVLSSVRKSRLSEICGAHRREHCMLPEGSIYRRNQLMAGRWTGDGPWPDGRPKQLVLAVRRVSRTAVPAQTSSASRLWVPTRRLRAKTAEPGHRSVLAASTVVSEMLEMQACGLQVKWPVEARTNKASMTSPSLPFAETPASFIPGSVSKMVPVSESQAALRELVELEQSGLRIDMPK